MPHSTNYISKINVNGQDYDIISTFDNPIHFEGVVSDASSWTSETVQKTGPITLTTGSLDPLVGCMVLADTREYVCTYISGSGDDKQSTWHRMGFIRRDTGTIYHISSGTLNTGEVVSDVSTSSANAIIDVSLNTASAVTSVEGDTSTYIVIDGDISTATYSYVVTKTQQVVTSTTNETSPSLVTSISLTDGSVTDKTAPVVTSLTGKNSTHSTGTVMTGFTQNALSSETTEVVGSVTLPTLGTKGQDVVYGINYTPSSVNPSSRPYVTSVSHSAASLTSAEAVTSIEISQGTDEKSTALTAVKTDASITPSTGSVLIGYTPEDVSHTVASYVTETTQAESTSAPFVNAITKATLTSVATAVVTDVTGGSFVTGTQSTAFVTDVSQAVSSSTPSSALFSVDASNHVLTLCPSVTVVTAVGTVTYSTANAITSVGTSAISLGTANVVGSYTWDAGNFGTASAVTEVGAVTNTKGTAVASISWTPSSSSSATINTSYDLTNMTFESGSFVTKSGTRGLTPSCGSFATGITNGTVSVETANAIYELGYSSGVFVPSISNVNVVESWTVGSQTPSTVMTSVSGGMVTASKGDVVTSVTDSSIGVSTANFVSGTSYVAPTLNTTTGTIKYLNGATLTTVNVVSSVDNSAAVTSVPHASKTVVTGVSKNSGDFAISVNKASAAFIDSVTGNKATGVVTSFTVASQTVVTSLVE